MQPRPASDCVFCGIVAGRLPSSVLLEDELVLAFMDLHQLRSGKALIIPKEHVSDLREFDDALDAAVMAATRRVAQAVSAAFQPHGLTISHNVGAAGVRRSSTPTST